MTDVEKLIEELGRMMSMNYNSAARVRDDAVNAINRLSNRLAAAEKVVDIARMAAPQMYRCGLMVTSEDFANALVAFDATKEPQ